MAGSSRSDCGLELGHAEVGAEAVVQPLEAGGGAGELGIAELGERLAVILVLPRTGVGSVIIKREQAAFA